MKQKFIINDMPIVIELTFMHLEQLLIDVTCLEDSWRNYIASGVRFIEIEGVTSDGGRIADKFQVIEKADEIFVLKSIKE